jgi:hypothetical protein
MLKYDTNLGGYRVNLTKEQLDKAPKVQQVHRMELGPQQRPAGVRLLQGSAV